MSKRISSPWLFLPTRSNQVGLQAQLAMSLFCTDKYIKGTPNQLADWLSVVKQATNSVTSYHSAFYPLVAHLTAIFGVCSVHSSITFVPSLIGRVRYSLLLVSAADNSAHG